MGFCSKLKTETIFSAKNPKTLHFPYPEPLKAKSINRKRGIQMEWVVMYKMVKINTKNAGIMNMYAGGINKKYKKKKKKKSSFRGLSDIW